MLARGDAIFLIVCGVVLSVSIGLLVWGLWRQGQLPKWRKR